jgi:hypothetical protein
MAKELSGVKWVSKFPTSASADDLTDPFKANVKKFLDALKTAGATVSISATKRPKERAYLMHWSWMIAKEGSDVEKVPAMAGVEIEWVHKDEKGTTNVAESKSAAEMMVSTYGIAYKPVLTSRHEEGNAIDMDVSWSGAELKIKDGEDKDVSIKTGAKDGSNSELQKVGKSYSVIKLVSDPPHWSSDGH